ncbi:Transcription factor 25, variant 3 [Entomophthora muscae]|uniref:Transcription factor 25, variant 3 n=1 Tax=Entomophthora muscae TaxID=34485 RepID=A0ACC2RED2_9FUNG|nr:Transcription factor 25, variant 3 [Entomophthora muscae]
MSHRALRKKLGGSNNPLDRFPNTSANNSESEDELLKLTAAKENAKKSKKKRNKGFSFAALNVETEENANENSDDAKSNIKVSEGEDNESKSAAPNPFDLLVDDEPTQPEELSESASEEAPIQTKPQPAKSSLKKKKNKKKRGAKGVSQEDKEDGAPEDDGISMQEFDKILNEVNSKFREQDLSRASNTDNKEKGSKNLQPEVRKRLLAIDPKNLDPMVETTRLFGSKIVQSIMQKKRVYRFGRCLLASPKDNWPPPDKTGLAMDSPEEIDGVRYFRFTHSIKYREIQRAFYQSVVSMDPNNIVMITHLSPYHVDALLQLSEISKNSGQVTEASELIERALFACEKSFHPTFSVLSGDCRLNFAQLENRPFFLSLLRRLQFLARQGCWRTALEFTKVLLSLSPNDDPLGALLYLDFFSLKSSEFQFLWNFTQQWPDADYLLSLPNFCYSQALASFRLSNGTDSGLLLGQAIVKFPSVLLGIAAKGKITRGNELDRIRAHATLFETSVRSSDSQLKALCDLYLERAFSLWIEADMGDFIQSGIDVAAQILTHRDNPVIEYYQDLWSADLTNEIPLPLCRHIVVAEIPDLMKHLPADVRSQTMYMHDPIPPLDSVSLYDDFRQLPGYGQARQQSFGSDISGSFTSAMDALRGLFQAGPAGQQVCFH